MRDNAAGERQIKLQTTKYLPQPSGFERLEQQKPGAGTKAYTAYLTRAQYPDILQPTWTGMIGVIHRVEAQIEGMDKGKPLAPLWERATKDGLPLEAFHRLITAELLLMGRYGVLVDVASDGGNKALPYLIGYTTEEILNWSDPDRDMFALDESLLVRGVGDEFSWTDELRYRALRLRDGVYSSQVYTSNASVAGEEVTPQLRGGKRLEEIPFVVANARNLSLALETPPLLGVARAALAIYRLDADYRHQLYMTGQETLFVIGDTENVPDIVGAGAIYALAPNSDVKYVSPSGVGINAHRQAIIDERANAVAAGVKLFDDKKAAESGEALRLRAAAQTATLTTIALASAACLEKALRYAAMFVGQNPDEIVVKPNLEFVNMTMTTREAADLAGVWQAGLISKQTAYEVLQRGNIASAERTFDEEEDLINQEIIDQPMAAEAGGGFNIAQPGGGVRNRLNGGTPPQGGTPDRFTETGEGLTFEGAQ